MYPRTIRNFNAFVDGTGYFGLVSMGKIPALKLKTAAHRGAGMDAPVAVDMGMEALQSELTFDEWNRDMVAGFATRVPMVLRPAAMGEDDFVADAWIYTMRIRIAAIDVDDLKPGEAAKMKITGEVDRLKIEKNGETLFDVDVETGKRVIGGVDQMADMRRAMGL